MPIEHIRENGKHLTTLKNTQAAAATLVAAGMETLGQMGVDPTARGVHRLIEDVRQFVVRNAQRESHSPRQPCGYSKHVFPSLPPPLSHTYTHTHTHTCTHARQHNFPLFLSLSHTHMQTHHTYPSPPPPLPTHKHTHAPTSPTTHACTLSKLQPLPFCM